MVICVLRFHRLHFHYTVYHSVVSGSCVGLTHKAFVLFQESLWLHCCKAILSVHCTGKPLETAVAFMSSGCWEIKVSKAAAMIQVTHKGDDTRVTLGFLMLGHDACGFLYVCFPEQMSLFAVHLSLRGFPGGNDEINYHLLYISMSVKDIIL